MSKKELKEYDVYSSQSGHVRSVKAHNVSTSMDNNFVFYVVNKHGVSEIVAQFPTSLFGWALDGDEDYEL